MVKGLDVKEAHIVSNLAALVAQKAKQENRKISYRTIVKETGIGLTSVQHWMTSSATQYQQAQIIALCRWLKCDVGDLLKIEADTD